MKSLRESLFDSKTQMNESLFDRDLVEKGVEIDFDTLRNMLFDFGRQKIKLFNKAGVIYHEGEQNIYIKRFIDSSKNKEAICFELRFGVTNLYNSKGEKTHIAFYIPELKSYDMIQGALQGWWRYSSTDSNTISRALSKKTNKEYINGIEIIANSQSVGKVFALYDKMVEYFCSDEFKEILQDCVNKFESKQVIPGLILDTLMKKLINKA